MKSKKWIPAVAGLAAAVAVAFPFLYVSRPNDPQPQSNAAVAASPMAPSLPALAIEGADGLSPEQKEMVMLEQHLSNAPAHTPVLMRLAELARASGKLPDAVKYLKQAVEADASNQDARLELGRALFETGDVQGAIAETRTLLEMNPNHADALYNLGAIEGNLGNFAEARRYWQAAVKASPASESASKSKSALAMLP